MLSLLAACALAQTPPTSLAPSPPSTAPSPPAVSPAVSPAAGSPPADILSCVNQLACTEGAPVNCDVLASYFIPGSCAGSCTVDEKDAIYAALKAGVPTLNGTLTLDCVVPSSTCRRRRHLGEIAVEYGRRLGQLAMSYASEAGQERNLPVQWTTSLVPSTAQAKRALSHTGSHITWPACVSNCTEPTNATSCSVIDTYLYTPTGCGYGCDATTKAQIFSILQTHPTLLLSCTAPSPSP